MFRTLTSAFAKFKFSYKNKLKRTFVVCCELEYFSEASYGIYESSVFVTVFKLVLRFTQPPFQWTLILLSRG
jgi:hypothetical protein